MTKTILQFKGADISKKYYNLARRVPELKRQGLLASAEDAKSEFEKTVATWKTKPDFEVVETARGVTVSTDSEIYKFVDKGTKPHIIRPVNASQLSFQNSYKPKTQPKIITSYAGGASGAWAHAKEVHHPGSEARDFSRIIFALAQKTVADNVTKALKGGMEAVGL